jgi:site-specific recombinase XerD
LIDTGADVFNVQKLMGHAQTQTPLRYDRRDEKAKRKAIQLLTIPY